MIKIEVTGNSIPEVADKLLAIGNSLRRTGIADADNAYRQALQEKRDAAAAEITTAAAEIAQTKRSRKPKDENPTPTSAPAEQPAAETPSEGGSAPSPSDASPSDEAASTLDYTKDVMPAVLRAVETQGRERVIALLGSMGVDKASQLPESRWPELMKALNA